MGQDVCVPLTWFIVDWPFGFIKMAAMGTIYDFQSECA